MRLGLLVETGPSGARGKDLLNGATMAAEEIGTAGYKMDGRPLTIRIEASDERGEIDLARQAERQAWALQMMSATGEPPRVAG